MKYLGCAYYPEYWGRERYETDAQLMRAAGINIVRVGEFAWSRMEPEEGVFTLEWLHEMVQVMGKYGINILMCTPTAAPPVWLTSTYPDTIILKQDGKRMEHGTRRHYCYTSDTYRRHTKRIVEKLSVEFSKYENVVAWQIDNEPDLLETEICCCDSCQGQFQAWLNKKYGSIKELNKKWGTGFWSMDYYDWRQVRLAEMKVRHYPSRKLDTLRFASDAMIDFILMQADIIRENHPGSIVSTNLNGAVFTHIDYYKLFSKLDIAFKDQYFDVCTMDVNVMIMNQFRSFKAQSKYWVTETGAGALDHGRPPHKDQFKAWIWSSFAHGADAYLVFRWRTCLSGQEQELQGILEHSGIPGHRYKAVKECYNEMREMSAALGDLPLPEAEVAIIHDYNVMWAYQSSVVGADVKYSENFFKLHQELYQRNILADIIPTDRDLVRYKLVILPSLMMITEDFAKRLAEFVSRGGVIFAQGQIGMRDSNANYLEFKGPGYLQELLGVYVSGGMYLFSQVEADEGMMRKKNRVEMKLAGTLSDKQVEGTANAWIADMELNGGRTLVECTNDTYSGQPAIVEKNSGKGCSIYVAVSEVDKVLMSEIFDYVISKAELTPGVKADMYVEIVRRGNVLFAINHSKNEASVDIDAKGSVLMGDMVDSTVKLPPYGVFIMKI